VQCLDDDMVVRLLRGDLAAGALATADEHLDSCGDCRALVAIVARGTQPDALPETTLARGATIGRYVIGDEVGRGAMGVVYAARDPELDRRIAIKVLHERDHDPVGARNRMLREAQAMARLSHPNVVTVHEVGTIDGRVFVAMELVRGLTLREWAAEERSVADVCDVMEAVGRGLSAAHAAGVVHRDVKPENVIVGADGRVRVGDFGLAGPGASEGEPSRSREITGVAGTPAYMAPEVLRGERADARSDQFAYAVTFWEALHGERPFGGRSWKELLAAIEQGKTLPGRRPGPAWLDTILRRALSPRGEDRHPTMDDLLGAIAVRRQRRAWRWAGAAAAAVAASALTWGVGAVAHRDPAVPMCDGGTARIAVVWNEGARNRMRTAFAGLDAPDSNAVAERTIRAIDSWSVAWAGADDAACRGKLAPVTTPGEHAARTRCLERWRTDLAALVRRLETADREAAHHAIEAVGSLPSPIECQTLAEGAADPMPSDPAARAEIDSISAALADVRAGLSLGDGRAIVDTAAALAIRSETAGHPPTIGDARRAHASALRAAGRLPEADEAALASLWASERGHDALGVARAWLDLSILSGERRDLRAAEDRLRHAEAGLSRAGNPERWLAELEGVRGLVEYNRGRLEEAETWTKRSLERRRALAHGDDVFTARATSALGSILRARGRLDDALTLHEEALAVDRAALGNTHPDVARDLHNVAGVLRLRNDLAAALVRYREALAIERAALGEAHPAAGVTHNSIGLVLLTQGRLDEATTELEAALAILRAADHGDRALAMHNLGLVAQRRGDHVAALRWFDQAMSVYRATVGEGADAPVKLLADRAGSEAALGRRVRPNAAPGAIGNRVAPTGRRSDVGAYRTGQAW
jgi:eukaryotic-like serine/threonine-protein kinase